MAVARYRVRRDTGGEAYVAAIVMPLGGRDALFGELAALSRDVVDRLVSELTSLTH